jgi:ABC-type multidrug transport system fused ATPase/permease subunit
MDIYEKKSRWKVYLAIMGLLIIAASIVYTNYLVKKLKEEENKRIQQYRLALERTIADDSDCDLTLHTEILQGNTTIPVILTNEQDGIESAKNFENEDDTISIRKELNALKADKTNKPLQIKTQFYTNYLYFKNSKILFLLTYYPIFQFILIAVFVAFGYYAFSTARRSEQNRVWVGMAKETAHQLGTPITAIVAWIEYLRETHVDDETTQMVLNELNHDVNRLTLVADRFSKIGSAPELLPENVYSELERCRNYMQKRASKQVIFDFPDPDTHEEIEVQVNSHLFDWVIENLLRNALDAMDGKGKITAVVTQEIHWVNIEISDSGKGIPANKFKAIFQPGYTTKKRGWGLGLSLSKRIIEEYHNGKIFVKKSEIGEGATFCVRLPKG